MAWVRRVRTASGATAVQIAEYVDGRRRIRAHVGSAHTEAELGLLMEQARGLLADRAQGEFDLGVEPRPAKAHLVPAYAGATLFAEQGEPVEPVRVGAPLVLGTSSRLLFDALAGVYDDLGFGAVGDAVFRGPGDRPDRGADLDPGHRPGAGRPGPAAGQRARRCAAPWTVRSTGATATRSQRHASTTPRAPAMSRWCLYDVTTLYFEAEKEDDLRKVGYSKERRVDPQIVVGLLVDRNGFPLEIGCYEGNKAETDHDRADRAGVPGPARPGRHGRGRRRRDAARRRTWRALDEAGLRFIVGSRATKAPIDLASHFRWHGEAFTDGQIIDTITPRTGRRSEATTPRWRPNRCGTPPRIPARGGRSGPTPASAPSATARPSPRRRSGPAPSSIGEKAARTPRFVKTTSGTRALDQASLDARPPPGRAEGLRHQHRTRRAHARRRGHLQLPRPVARRASFRMTKTDLRARPMFVRTNATRSRPT